MRKIIVGAQVSMDCVMHAPGGPTEDPTRGFKFGGWAMPYFAQEFGEELHRSSELVHALLANDLVDAMSIFTLPVVLGGSKRLFADGWAPHSFKLTGSRVSPNGLIVGHYERLALRSRLATPPSIHRAIARSPAGSG